MDRDPAARIGCRHRHRLEEERLGFVGLAEIEGNVSAPGQGLGPQRAVGQLGRDSPEEFVAAKHVAGHDQVLGRGQETAITCVDLLGRRQACSLLGQPGRDVRCATLDGGGGTLLERLRDQFVGPDCRPRQVSGSLLGLGNNPGEPIVDLPALIGRCSAVRGGGKERMGETDRAVDDLEHADGLPTSEAVIRSIHADRGHDDCDGWLREGRSMERDLVGGRFQSGNVRPDQIVETARHSQHVVRRAPTTELEVAPKLERIERRAAGRGVEAGKERAREIEIHTRAQKGVGLIDRERPNVDARQPIGRHRG